MAGFSALSRLARDPFDRRLLEPLFILSMESLLLECIALLWVLAELFVLLMSLLAELLPIVEFEFEFIAPPEFGLSLLIAGLAIELPMLELEFEEPLPMFAAAGGLVGDIPVELLCANATLAVESAITAANVSIFMTFSSEGGAPFAPVEEVT